MKLIMNFTSKVKNFLAEELAVAALFSSFGLVIVAGVAGGAVDMTAYQTQKNNIVAALNSAGNYASVSNGCVGTSTSAVQACETTLQTLTQNYLDAVYGSNSPKVTVDTGLWCVTNGHGAFVSNTGSGNAQCASGGTAAVQVSGIATTKPSFLKLVGLRTLSENIKLTISNNRIDQFEGTQTCPGLLFDERVFTRADGSALTWDKSRRAPAEKGAMRFYFGKPWTYSDSYGSYTSQKPFWVVNGKEDNSSAPNFGSSETASGASTKSVTSSSSSSYKADGKHLHYTYTGSTIPTTSSDVGKSVYDPDLKANRAANDSNTFAWRPWKKLEGKTCLALLGGGSDTDKKYSRGGILVTIDKVCDGSRRWVSSTNSWKATKWDKSGDDSDCDDSVSGSTPTPSIRLRHGEGRTSDASEYVRSDYSKWKGRSIGSGNESFGMEGGPQKVADERS